MGVRVKSNRLPAVIRALPVASAGGVQRFAEQFSESLNQTIWEDTGRLKTTIRELNGWTSQGTTIGVGVYSRSGVPTIGFYAGFLEFGTVKMAPRPMVGPAAHANEPVLAATMSDYIQRACRAA